MSKRTKVSEIVKFLNEYVISQDEAKRELAVLIKNKERYEKIDEYDWKKNITPFNALIIGPTGSGKTELFRTLAEYLDVAFTKVDISSYTKTGYVGKSVDDIINVHLYEAAKKKAKETLKEELEDEIKQKVASMLAHAYVEQNKDEFDLEGEGNTIVGSLLFKGDTDAVERARDAIDTIKNRILNGDKDILDKEVTITVEMDQAPNLPVVPINLPEEFLKVKKTFTDTIENLLKMLIDIELDKAVKHNTKLQNKIKEYMENGIVFIDEIDKIAGKDNGRIESTGVQKELLTLIEGKTVMTEIGPVNTDHILFIAAGAFHTAKPSDLLPELLGRLPIRITLRKLTKDELRRILTEPKYAIVKKIKKLYEQDDIIIEFTEEALDEIANYADKFNNEDEYLGARRLHTIMTLITSDIDFEIEEGKWPQDEDGKYNVVISAEYVRDKIEEKSKKIEEALSYIENESSRKVGFIT